MITDLTSAQASPQRLELIVRGHQGHWGSRAVHHFGEDGSQTWSGHGPENLASLRNLACTRLRAAGFADIAAARREMPYDAFTAPPDLLGIPA